MEINIDGNKGTYFMDEIGTIQGRYLGKFVFKAYLTPIEIMKCDKRFREFIGEVQVGVDPAVQYLAFALTQLEARIISAPPFWNSEGLPIAGGNIPDRNIIDTLLEAATLTEKKYKEGLLDKHSQSLDKMKLQINKEKKDMEVNKEFEK